ncbi:hypothetical protein MRB53_040415 [Persea americana]|nr:hypothetical protein MRB53_040415 [Persea americana]
MTSLSVRLPVGRLARLRFSAPRAVRSLRYASTTAPETNKARILEKPTKFNPPSHGSRRVRPRLYPGPRLSEEELERQKTKRYPNMMPPEGSLMHRILTNRSLHLWITLSTLTFLTFYSVFRSFLHTTTFRDQLPSSEELLWHPVRSMRQFFAVYKLHVAHESQIVADKRRKKQEDAAKRKEFLLAHGVEPGFLTGTWLDNLGTVEGDKRKAAREKAEQVDPTVESPVAMEAVGDAFTSNTSTATPEQQLVEPKRLAEGAKPKRWFGIW